MIKKQVLMKIKLKEEISKEANHEKKGENILREVVRQEDILVLQEDVHDLQEDVHTRGIPEDILVHQGNDLVHPEPTDLTLVREITGKSIFTTLITLSFCRSHH